MRPRDARTFEQISSLQSECKETKHYWLMVNEDGTVALREQITGAYVTASMNIPRREWNALVDWYMKEQEPKHV
ncbi:MAG: hypothetical protein ABFC80_08090 [Coriobacteriales bacterium]